MLDKKIKLLFFKTYLAVLENSVGSKQYRSLFAKMGNKKIDILRNGELSCASYTTSILYLFGQIKRVHATVDSTVSDLQKSGWKKIKKPLPGSVLVWEARAQKGSDVHKHVGFYIGKGVAVSNSSKLRKISKHSWNYRGKRKVELILWNSKFSRS